jgi:hypothetical protein
MRKIYGLLIMLFWVTFANAESFIQQHIPKAKQVSTARYSVFLFDVYDATFYTASGKPEVIMPFALKLAYLRSFKGEDIADRSAEEMREYQGIDEITLAGWHTQMRSIFPNVTKGDSITGVYPDQAECIFYKNNTLVGHVTDAQFCNAFFDIWFGKNTSAPKLREKLLTQTTLSIRKSKEP